MKKITKSIVAVFAIATTLVSCTKDNNSTTSDPMQGKWTVDSAVMALPNSAPQPFDIQGNCTVKNYINLQTAGAIEEGELDTDTCEISVLTGTWKKTNSTLEVTDTDGKTTYQIISVTANKLVLRETDLGSQAPAGTYVEATLSKK